MTLKKTSKRLATSALVVLMLSWQLVIPIKAGATEDRSTDHSETCQTARTNAATDELTTQSNTCEPPTGSIEVNKKVDTDGDGYYESGNTTANNLGFAWGLDNETASRGMGTWAHDVNVGTHTITENAINGYVFTGWYYTDDYFKSCSHPRGTTLPVSIEVEKHKTSKVTLCNKAAPGSITIIKDAQPDSDQNFAFGIDKKYSYWDEQFTLDDDGNPNNYYKNAKTFNGLKAGTYVVTEAETFGWELSDITCSQGADVAVYQDQRKAVITLHPGDAVTCTFVNQKKGKITVYKHTQPAGSQTKFAIKAETDNGHVYGDTSRWIADGEREYFVVSQGTYAISETLPEGWVQVGNTCRDITVTADNLYPVCHITNAKGAKLKIKKEAGPESEQDFTFKSAALGDFTLDDDNDPALANYKQFSNLAAGYYTITEDAVAGWGLKALECWGARHYDTDIQAGTLVVKLKPGDDVTCKFTNIERNAISGYKFEDLNGNGAWDKQEPTIAGWAIVLSQNCGDDCTNEVEAITDEKGRYNFDELEPGVYTVCERDRTNWVQTSPQTDDGCYQITLEEPGEKKQDAHFGNFELGTVAGVKFNDANGNGTQDPSEQALGGWTINLYDATGSNLLDTLDKALATTTTDSKGSYSFTGLAAGKYRVCEVARTGWVRTYPAASDCHEFTITMSGQQVVADFGNRQIPQVLGASTAPKELVKTGSSIVRSLLAGMTILGILAAMHYMTVRRKDYAK